LASMFNPVGAIVQAILTIYNTVMFFVERINQIMAFVEAIVSSVYKIATGDIASAANWVEQALARTIPIIIGFLARLVGLGDVSEKIQGFIQKVQGGVDKAIDKAIEKVVRVLHDLFAPTEKADEEDLVYPDETFEVGNEKHRIWVKQEGDTAV